MAIAAGSGQVSHQCGSCSGPSWLTGWGRHSDTTAMHTYMVSPHCAVSYGCSGPIFHWRTSHTSRIQTSCRRRRDKEREGGKNTRVIYRSQSWLKMLQNVTFEKENGGCLVLVLTPHKAQDVMIACCASTHTTHTVRRLLLVCHVCISRHWFFCPGLPPPPFILCFAPGPRGLEKFCYIAHTQVYTPRRASGENRVHLSSVPDHLAQAKWTVSNIAPPASLLRLPYQSFPQSLDLYKIISHTLSTIKEIIVI